MPNGPFLYADQLLSVLTAKSEQGGFKDLVIYVVRAPHATDTLYFAVTWPFVFCNLVLRADSKPARNTHHKQHTSMHTLSLHAACCCPQDILAFYSLPGESLEALPVLHLTARRDLGVHL